jgi:hypothetical protein
MKFAFEGWSLGSAAFRISRTALGPQDLGFQ